MLHQIIARLWLRTGQAEIIVAALVVLVISSHALGRGEMQRSGIGPQKACESKLLNSPRLRVIDKGRPRRFNRFPVVSFSVSEDGSVHDVKMAKTSRSSQIDDEILDQVKSWKYNVAPGCGVRDARVKVIIDLR